MSELNLIYVSAGQIGYGRVGVELERRLTERGTKVWTATGDPDPNAQTRMGTGDTAPSPPNLTCLISVPSHHQGHFDGQHTAIITMFEATRLPEAFRENLHEFDTVIVPSWQNVELFSRYHPNVKFMPLGIDPTLWHYVAPSPPEREFRFLISGRGNRKGVDLAYRAFNTVFNDSYDWNPAPKLVMKSRMGHQDFWGRNVEQVTGTLDPTAERDLYASAHCYLQPSRGEGFGLQPLQALALGRPTILTAAHGHESYAHLGIGIGSELVKADEFFFGDAGDWWEPDFEELCEAMWDVYKNYATHCERAKFGADRVAKGWTWEAMADRFVEILGPEMDKPYSGDGTWHKSERKLYKVIVYRDWSCMIAGRTLFFEAGKEYWESADVKRNLFDGGLLDNACIDDADPGLAEFQVEQLGLYRAQHAACPSCGRSCECETRTDQIEREMIEEETRELVNAGLRRINMGV